MLSINILCCPICRGSLTNESTNLRCSDCNASYSVADGIVRALLPNQSADLALSLSRWDAIYAQSLATGSYLANLQVYKETYYEDLLAQITEETDLKDKVYLEVGCGPFYFGHLIARDCKLVIGIDFSFNALVIAKKLFDSAGITNYILIQGDVLQLPLKDHSVDLVYGGGVMEHFNNSQAYLNGLYTVLRPGGIVFNTVPFLNIGSLTYRQLWGNIPNVPVLKQIFEFIHIKLFGGRFMRFGYELAFLVSTLCKLHKKVGFSEVSVSHFKVALVFEALPRFLRRPFVWLANNSKAFWPMVKVVAKK